MSVEGQPRSEGLSVNTVGAALDEVLPALREALARLEALERTAAAARPPTESFPHCARCGGAMAHGPVVDQWFFWLKKCGWQGALQYVIMELAWGIFAWRGRHGEPDARYVCLLVQDDALPAACTEVLERIEAGRTRPLPASSEVVTWEEWPPEEAQAAPMALGTGQARVGAIDWAGGGVTLAHPAALVVPAAGDALPGVVERELQAYMAERQARGEQAAQEEGLRRAGA